MAAIASSVPGIAVQQRRRLLAVGVLGGALALVIGMLAGSLSASGRLSGVLIIAGLGLPILIWKWPQASLIIALLMATLVEQFPLDAYPLRSLPAPMFTDRLALFQSLNDADGVSGVLLNPIELLVLLTLLIWLMRAILDRTFKLPRSYLALGFVMLLGLAMFAEVRGLAAGADLRETLRELRPFVYLGVFYVLGSQLLTRRGALRALLWAVVIGSGVKGVQGTYQYLAVRNTLPRPEAVLAHEEAVFLGIFLLLTAALWIFDGKSRLRLVATGLAPLVLVADIANNRRSAWIILGMGLAALFLIAWIRLPQRRAGIFMTGLVLGIIASAYFPLFWNGNGGFSQPARAVRSMMVPDLRDAASNLYRQQEDANLRLNIQRTMPLGAGFGVPIDYALPIVDLTATNPSLRFVPHNTILYVWMRMGVLGMLAFWWVIGAGFLTAGCLVRSRDRTLALFGVVGVCALIAYVLEGNYDLGLSWFRVAVYMGCILGAMEAARQLGASAAEPTTLQRAA